MNRLRQPPPWLMIATGMLVTLVVVVFARLAYGLIMPPMRESLGLSYQQAGNLGTASALGYLCLVMFAGMVAARWGGRLSVLLGLSLATIGFFGLALASNYLLLLAMMLLLGFGTAFSYTPLLSLLSNWFPARRGAVIGMLNSGVGLGMLVAGSLVPYMTESFGNNGWRLTWAIFAVVGMLVIFAGIGFLRNPPGWTGSGDKAEPGIEKSAVYRNRHVITVGLVYGVVGLTYIVQTIFMYSFALESGIAPLLAGQLASVMGVLSIFSGIVWGWLSDRVGRAMALSLSMAFTLVGTLLPVIWPTLLGFAAHYIILGLVVSGMFTSAQAASTERVEPRHAPLAVSFVTLFFATGQLIGPAAAGLFLDWTGSFRLVFGITSAIMLVGVVLALQTRGLKPDAAAVAEPEPVLKAEH